MKAQNLRILEALSRPNDGASKKRTKSKKRKRDRSESRSDGATSDDSSRAHKPGPSGAFAKDHCHPDSGTDPDPHDDEIVIEDDMDLQIDSLLRTDEKVPDKNPTNDPLDEIQEELEEEEETGPKVSERLAKIVQAMAQQKLSEEKIKEKLEKHRRPENVAIHVPKVNPEIWNLMDHSAKAMDLKAQRSQKRLVKASYALTKVCEGLLVKPTENKESVRDVTDALALILRASHDLAMERRTKILNSSSINKKYRRLASPDIKVTDNLFGDDLKTSLSTIDATSKLEQSLAHANRSAKYVHRAGAKNGDREWRDRSVRGRGRGWSRGKVPMTTRGRGFTKAPRTWHQQAERV